MIDRVIASRFFSNSPIQDEKVAIMPTGQEVDFDAGIERGLKKKRTFVHTQRLVHSLRL
jgi:hypothetical protein